MNTQELWALINKAEDHYKPIDYTVHPDNSDILIEAFDGEKWHENEFVAEELDGMNEEYKEARAYYYG